jgi:predicted nucleic acid-binding protein
LSVRRERPCRKLSSPRHPRAPGRAPRRSTASSTRGGTAAEVLGFLRQGLLVWWASAVECASAIARLEREGELDDDLAAQAFDRLTQLAAGWNEVDASAPIRETAIRLLRVHPLRGTDALQLAAAHVASGGQPSSLGIVTLDGRLATAARKEGFAVITA